MKKIDNISEEDRILDKMDIIWYQMNPQERKSAEKIILQINEFIEEDV